MGRIDAAWCTYWESVEIRPKIQVYWTMAIYFRFLGCEFYGRDNLAGVKYKHVSLSVL